MGGVEVEDGTIAIKISDRADRNQGETTKIYNKLRGLVNRLGMWRTFDRRECMKRRVYLEIDSPKIPEETIKGFEQNNEKILKIYWRGIMSIKLSYGITTHNEAEELNRLLEILVHKTDVEDEIVIVDDFSNQETQDVIGSWVQQYSDKKTIRVFQRKLDKDFASQKNFVIEQCTGDYIFHLDADEYPHEVLLLQLKQILEINDVI